MRPKALIMTGHGLNCEKETAHAFKLAGAEPHIVFIQDLIDGHVKIHSYDLICFIGGFSAGDHLGSGKVQSVKLKLSIEKDLLTFTKPILGICNGFQTLVQMGLLSSAPIKLSLNDSCKYEDRWIRLKVKTPSFWFEGMEEFELPVRHKEGKFIFSGHFPEGQIALQYIDKMGEPTQRYPDNPNGSQESIAAISNEKGNVLGLMPHPEAFIFPYHYPQWMRRDQVDVMGLKLFQNAVNRS